MSPATLTERPGATALWPPPAAPDATLAAAVESLWDRLTAHAPVACLVCGGEMRPQYSAGAGVVAGRCTHCGAALD